MLYFFSHVGLTLSTHPSYIKYILFVYIELLSHVHIYIKIFLCSPYTTHRARFVSSTSSSSLLFIFCCFSSFYICYARKRIRTVFGISALDRDAAKKANELNEKCNIIFLERVCVCVHVYVQENNKIRKERKYKCAPANQI